MIFQFTYGDEKYQFDDEKMGLGEARYVKQVTGMVGQEFFEAARKLDPDAIVAILVMSMRRAGKTEVSMDDIYTDDDNGYYKLITGMEVLESAPEAPKNGPVRTRKLNAKE